MKKKTNVLGITFIFIILLTLGSIGFSSFMICKELGLFNKEPQVIEYSNNLYKEPTNMTEYGKSLYQDLCIEVEKYENSAMNKGDVDELAISVAKIFIYDYYTWSNKKGSFDVGGLNFVDPLKAINITEYSRMNHYKNFDSVLASIGDISNMPEVIDVSVISTTDNSITALITYKESLYDLSYLPTSVEINYDIQEYEATFKEEDVTITKTVNRVVISSLGGY